jgi:DNA-binding NtrC family response regulator
MGNAPSHRGQDGAGRPPAVLVVDDERAIRKSLQQQLTEAGYVVDVAEDGLDALQRVRLRSEPYSAVVLDVVMPIMDGLAVLERLQLEHRETAERVVLVSAWLDASRVQQMARRAGCPLVEKPVEPEVLLRTIERIVACQGENPGGDPEPPRLVRRILVVDDDAAVRRFLMRYLARQGYQVYPAEDGIEALAVLRHTAVDFALIDLDMPRMSGIELVQRCEDEFPDLTYVIMSGEPDAVLLAERKLSLRSILLRKPFELDDVDAIVPKILQSRTERRREP